MLVFSCSLVGLKKNKLVLGPLGLLCYLFVGLVNGASAQDQQVNGNVYAGAPGSYWAGFRSNAGSGTWGFQQADRAMIGLGGNVYGRGFSNHALALFNGSIVKEDVYLYNQNAADADFLVLKNTGNVGINVINPLYRVDVGGSGNFFSGNHFTRVVLNDGGGALALPAGGGVGTHGAPADKYPLRLYENLGWNFTVQNILDPVGYSSAGFRVRTAGEAILFDVRSDGHVGLGTEIPAEQLELKSDAPVMVYHKPGVASYKLGVDNAGVFRIAGMDNAYGGHTGNFLANNEQVMVMDKSGRVGIGVVAPTERLSVKGTVKAQEIKVDMSGWPDYVFGKDYPLMRLSEVARYISDKRHLPGLPAAREVEEKGLAVGDMSKRLLEKVEEMMLHLIEKDQQIQKLQQEVELLKQKVD